MSNSDTDSMDWLDTDSLTAMLVDLERPPEVHRGALLALLKRDPLHRNPRLPKVMRAVISRPSAYDQESLTAMVDILATDPDPESTGVMLEILPLVLESFMRGKDALPAEFRQYFYEALATRQRDEDLEIWAAMLPGLDAKSLIALVLDPVAGPLEIIEPVTLIDRLAEPERSKSLFAVLIGTVRVGASPEQIKPVVQALRRSADPAQMKAGIEALEGYWDRARKAGRKNLAVMLEKILRALDPRPRSAAERLTGKRPWAS